MCSFMRFISYSGFEPWTMLREPGGSCHGESVFWGLGFRVLTSNHPFQLSFFSKTGRRFRVSGGNSRKKDPWKEWNCKVPLEVLALTVGKYVFKHTCWESLRNPSKYPEAFLPPWGSPSKQETFLSLRRTSRSSRTACKKLVPRNRL